jgi:hypothetical protein
MNGSPGSGIVSGGWEFVVAAYVVSGLVFGAYFVILHLRYRAERARDARLHDPRRHEARP